MRTTYQISKYHYKRQNSLQGHNLLHKESKKQKEKQNKSAYFVYQHANYQRFNLKKDKTVTAQIREANTTQNLT